MTTLDETVNYFWGLNANWLPIRS